MGGGEGGEQNDHFELIDGANRNLKLGLGEIASRFWSIGSPDGDTRDQPIGGWGSISGWNWNYCVMNSRIVWSTSDWLVRWLRNNLSSWGRQKSSESPRPKWRIDEWKLKLDVGQGETKQKGKEVKEEEEEKKKNPWNMTKNLKEKPQRIPKK